MLLLVSLPFILSTLTSKSGSIITCEQERTSSQCMLAHLWPHTPLNQGKGATERLQQTHGDRDKSRNRSRSSFCQLHVNISLAFIYSPLWFYTTQRRCSRWCREICSNIFIKPSVTPRLMEDQDEITTLHTGRYTLAPTLALGHIFHIKADVLSSTLMLLHTMIGAIFYYWCTVLEVISSFTSCSFNFLEIKCV